MDYNRLSRFADRRDFRRRRGCRISGTPIFAFPQPLAEKYRPRRIADFVGLERPKKIIGQFAANPYQSAWLFVGPPGVGKTSMALAVAAQIDAEIHHIPSQKCNAQAIDDTCHMCAYVPLSNCMPKANRFHHGFRAVMSARITCM